VMQRMTTMPLNVDDLLGELEDPSAESYEGMPSATTMGHVHLRVSEIPETTHFYRDVLGFDLVAALGAQAAFFSAGGYHHHLGANTWESAGASPAPEGTARLRHATVVLPDDAARDEILQRVEAEDAEAGPVVRDPSGNSLLLA
jgi:catechol 2,3-dioxygenase